MNNIIVNFVEKIERMTAPTLIKDKFERQWMKREYSAVNESSYPTLESYSLRSIVDYIKNNDENLVIDIESYKKVSLKSIPYGDFKNRDLIIKSEALLPNITTERYQEQEDFIVNLLSRFKENMGRDYALSIASQMVEGKEVKVNDDGISQRVIVNQGVSSLKEKDVNPYLKLIPYRTFQEVEQPASLFLIRMKTGPSIAIFEADGGAWKYEAIKNIAKYFEDELIDHKERFEIVY